MMHIILSFENMLVNKTDKSADCYRTYNLVEEKDNDVKFSKKENKAKKHMGS